jgi:hydroxymethylpyrimidine pyrophosphatase-like HAD family hydrolase
MASIHWNDEVKLILSDVDETIADLYVEAVPEMHAELTSLLREGIPVFFVTGQGLKSVQWRIIDHLPLELRKRILVGHCSGAEVVGFNEDGTLREKPFYSVYDQAMNEEQKQSWRVIVDQLVREFKLEVYPTMPVHQFMQQAGKNPLAVMLEDRGPQITFEVVNGYDLTAEQEKELEVSIPQTHGAYDLRIPLLERADVLLQEAELPVTPKLGGVFALDFAIKGVSKTTAVKFAIEDGEILQSIGITRDDLSDPRSMEVWGDKFSVIRGGTDRYMSQAVSPEVRSIDFRQENPEEFEVGYNIVVWDGEKHLHEGTLEYLKMRRA